MRADVSPAKTNSSCEGEFSEDEVSEADFTCHTGATTVKASNTSNTGKVTPQALRPKTRMEGAAQNSAGVAAAKAVEDPAERRKRQALLDWTCLLFREALNYATKSTAHSLVTTALLIRDSSLTPKNRKRMLVKGVKLQWNGQEIPFPNGYFHEQYDRGQPPIHNVSGRRHWNKLNNGGGDVRLADMDEKLKHLMKHLLSMKNGHVDLGPRLFRELRFEGTGAAPSRTGSDQGSRQLLFQVAEIGPLPGGVVLNRLLPLATSPETGSRPPWLLHSDAFELALDDQGAISSLSEVDV